MKLLLYSTCLWLIALDTQAQVLKPGLWEVVMKSTSESGSLEKSTALVLKTWENRPLEQRRAYEAKMAQSSAQFSAGNLTLKSCLTPAMVAEKVVLPQAGALDKDGCTVADVSRKANTVRSSFFCPVGEVHGEREVEFDGSSPYIIREASTTYFPMLTQGKPDLFTLVSSMRFLSTQCGNLKPTK